ncbi:hypothetical protein KIPB_014106 [Kipferlia bialata]|uniref:HAT C-terminal dimerisation domain-containing protein n=1 Tax=Kipferlia bialata TaxID=797122 RepID=A0A9K3DBB1_9EUKA|nr:hypothetical protein KIPB_014106 [Kipferlia bialata]|eukprot:g14106.t1
MPASEAACERSFSIQGRIHSKLRSCLSDESVAANVFLAMNYNRVHGGLDLQDPKKCDFSNITEKEVLALSGMRSIQLCTDEEVVLVKLEYAEETERGEKGGGGERQTGDVEMEGGETGVDILDSDDGSLEIVSEARMPLAKRRADASADEVFQEYGQDAVAGLMGLNKQME